MSFGNRWNQSPKEKDPARVIRRLKVRLQAEHNRALNIWEHELQLALRPKPWGIPAWLWRINQRWVVRQGMEVLNAPEILDKDETFKEVRRNEPKRENIRR